MGFIAQDALWKTRALLDVTLEVCGLAPSVFSLQMLYEVNIYVVWNAVDFCISNMNLTNRRLLSISNADALCLCRLLMHATV